MTLKHISNQAQEEVFQRNIFNIMPKETLNLINTPCPINFVRTKLKLDEMQAGNQLIVTLDDGEAITSVTTSIQEEGHIIKAKTQQEDGSWLLEIIKTAS